MLCRGVLEGATGLLNKGGGSNRLPGLVNNKLWNFHRYRLVMYYWRSERRHIQVMTIEICDLHNNTLAHGTVTN